ncbi:hypothetical protein PSOLE_36090 [Pseudomonas oleovorans subsp. oleovorans]|uniref:Uncharacterized protein n=1 Tax=Ectopseudomonas oleovorans TaxID=301 RepID=A0A379PK01_ECTOL|nr:hypothetical protein PSOLE_36090 [Pseudomonas oleovorans subsp. oleovorans]SEJ63412.1 hypothetical protein SAMN05216280_10337 [Pseudomonas oleovorans]SUE72475.1 Uncharacterised protein [Pseudomonas oleovorans]
MKLYFEERLYLYGCLFASHKCLAMSLFQCEVCGCRENTAHSMPGFKGITECYDWSFAPERDGLLVCSACGPSHEARGSGSGFVKCVR